MMCSAGAVCRWFLTSMMCDLLFCVVALAILRNWLDFCAISLQNRPPPVAGVATTSMNYTPKGVDF